MLISTWTSIIAQVDLRFVLFKLYDIQKFHFDISVGEVISAMLYKESIK